MAYRRGVLMVVFSILCAGVSAMAQNDDPTNYGGIRQFKLSPGSNLVRGLFIQEGNSNDPLDMPQPPSDVYQLINLVVGHTYTLTVSKVDGYSGFNVIDRISGQGASPINVTYFSETIRPSGISYGPIELSLIGGMTSLLPAGLAYASTDYEIILADDSAPPAVIQPVSGIHDGMLIKSVNPSNQTVYLIQAGAKRGFPSSYHFNSWYFGRWDRITLVADFVVNNTPSGPVMPFNDGTVVKYSDQPTNATVYVIDQGLKRGFATWSDFTGYGHSPSDIMLVPSAVLNTVGVGAVMPSPGGSPTTGQLQITFSPNPVTRSSDSAWYYTVYVTDTTGTAVSLTRMIIGGVDYSSYIQSWFGTTTVPANGRLSVNIKTTGSSGAEIWQFFSSTSSWSGSISLQ